MLSESTESNNTVSRSDPNWSRPHGVGADGAGQRLRRLDIVVNDTTKNLGGGAASASVTRFYLSTDTVLDGNDTTLAGSRDVGVLDAGATSSGSTTVTIPASTPAGSYYILAKADADS